MDGKDTVALLPTGGGKSICFQIPSLVSDGICIVVSPLVALMKDQVSQLKNKGIKALAIPGGIKFDELDALLDNCIYGNYKFLYLSPERLQQDLVKERIRSMTVNCIAVDEAHCISQWGNDFRPAYKHISSIRKLQPAVPIIALTATATPQVLHDILTDLELKEHQLFQSSFTRENVGYYSYSKANKRAYATHALKATKDSAIVYVRNRRDSESFSEHLNHKNIRATYFHGGLTTKEKDTKLKKWLSNDIQVMVATNAFGMGIDKPDVRIVIHLQLPDSIESYYQETGRAGRDGKPSHALLIINENDQLHAINQFVKTLPTVPLIKEVYKKLNSYFKIPYGEGMNEQFDLPFPAFCRKYEFNMVAAYNCLTALDRYSILSLSKQFNKKTRIKFLATSNQMFDFIQNDKVAYDVMQSILRTYGGSQNKQVDLNIALMEAKSGQMKEAIYAILRKLEKGELIDLQISDTDAHITFLKPREDDYTINKIAKNLKRQNKHKEGNLHKLIEFVTNNELCKNIQLLEYFGEVSTKPCGNCNVCKAKEQSINQKDRLQKDILAIISKKSQRIGDLCVILNKEEIIIAPILSQLLEQDLIEIDKTNRIKSK